MDSGRAIDSGRAWELLLALSAWPERLSDAGLAVDPSGAWSADRPVDPAAAALFDLYLGFALADAARPITLGHLGQSLDGHIATAEGRSHYVTGPENIVHLHRMRALADAVIVGVGTVEADDPRLTVRRVAGPDPLRVVIDPRGRISANRLLLDSGIGGTLLVLGEDAEAPAGIPEAVAVLRLPVTAAGIAPGIQPRAVVAALRERGFHRLFVEGGGVTVSGFLAAGALDRLQVTVAPVLIGGGRPGLTLPTLVDLAQAPRPSSRCFPMGCDVLFDCDFRSGAEGAAAPPAGPGGRS